jgi:type I restriction enzyme R subunit
MQATELERRTQDRTISQLQQLGWRYLGNWQDRATNYCVEQKLLYAYLEKRQYAPAVAQRAVEELISLTQDQHRELYPINKDVYQLLRYGAKVKPGPGEANVDVAYIDWGHWQLNDFAFAEEVTVTGGANTKRPDIVLYVNGSALGMIELKRTVVSIGDGIRQIISNQRAEFIPHFFATQQLLLAANESQGLRYGTTGTPEKYFLRWKDEADSPEPNLLRREIGQLLQPERFLEIVKTFVLFDGGVKKVCRPHQYFAVRAAADRVRDQDGGIIWHTQGSGKSLTMVWLAQWITENLTDARVLVITDRDELDKQIVRVFEDTGRSIERATSGDHLLRLLNAHQPSLICSLIHKFGTQVEGEVPEERFVRELRAALPEDFRPKGNFFVFVDECHRTQSGKLHLAMKDVVLPGAVFIGFTGTPLMSKDKQRSIEVFGSYIGRPYKFDQAVEDGVVLDLRYEARDIAQRVTDQRRVDQWFEAKTRGLNKVARHQLVQKWGTMRKLLSSKSRLESIVSDIAMDFATRPRLESGRGNAMLVAGSVYEACRYYELFQQTELARHCAIITSYEPAAGKISKEDSGTGATEELLKYAAYQKMLDGKAPEDFEREAKRLFVKEPGRMKLLIVVDKLLTGFDAPSATYLFVDKSMRDHGLFQAICRVNRLDGEGKDYGYIIDYKDLFKSLEKSINDYTTEAFDGYDEEDVAGLIEDRRAAGFQRLHDSLDACEALVEPLGRTNFDAQMDYFCGGAQDAGEMGGGEVEAERVPAGRRKLLYKLTAEASRAYAAIAADLEDPEAYRRRVDYFEKLRKAVQLRSGDRLDMKRYEADMHRLLDMYVTADPSRKISDLDDFSLIELIVERGIEEAIGALPEDIRRNEDSVAETILNNVRRDIVEKQSTNPEFFARMSQLLEEIIDLRDSRAIEYEEYLDRIAELTRKMWGREQSTDYPASLGSPRKRALYDNLNQDLELTLAMEEEIRSAARDGWRTHPLKRRAIKRAIQRVLDGHETFDPERILTLVENNPDE